MSQEGLSQVIGRAVLDPSFGEAVSQDPSAAASSIGADLTDSEVDSLKDLSVEHLQSVGNLLRQKLSPEAFFDQTQQQQQALMD